MRVIAIEPHGFCAGVTGALRKALALLDEHSNASTSQTSQTSSPLYCLHELVHNEIVVADLKARGMVFVERIDEVPEGATVLFSAHGVSPDVRRKAQARRLKTVDATCPFVARVHKAAVDFANRGLQVVVIGKPDHAEVKGITGEVPEAVVIDSPLPREGARVTMGKACEGARVTMGKACEGARVTMGKACEGARVAGERIGVVSQTTMNADEVAEIVGELRRHCDVETMAEVCNATKVRQDAVKAFGGDALLVLGSVNSSNTRRLGEVARCRRVFRAGTMDEVRRLDLSGVETLGVTSGASTPEKFFTDVMEYLKDKNESEA